MALDRRHQLELIGELQEAPRVPRAGVRQPPQDSHRLAIMDQAPGHIPQVGYPFNLHHRERAQPNGRRVTTDQAQRILRSEGVRTHACTFHCLGSGQDCAMETRLPPPNRNPCDGRQMHQIGRTDRTHFRNDWSDARIQHLSQHLHRTRMHSGSSPRHAGQASEH